MANVTLDSQTSFKPQHDTNYPQRGAGSASQDNALLISSDDESDYDDLDDGKCDISLPPIEELLRAAGRKYAEPGNVAGVDKSFSASPGGGGNSDAIEPSVTEGSNPDGDVASSQQPQIFHLQRSPAPPSAPALPRPLSASPGPLQVEQEDRPIPADSASCEAKQGSAPEDTTCGKPHGEISRASPPGVEAQHAPSPSRLSGPSPSRLEEGTDQESAPRRDSGGESDSDDEDGPPLAKPKFGGRRTMIGHRAHRSPKNSRVDPKDRDEVVQQSDGQDSSQRRLYRRRRNDREDEDVYHPPRASESVPDKEDNDIRSPQRKRLKTTSPAQPTLRTSTGWRTRSNGGPPDHDMSKHQLQAPIAKFQEFLLKDAVLKRVEANGLATFQIQFSWDSCGNHRHKDPTTGRLQYQSPVKRRPSTKRGVSTRARFTTEEDDLLVKLKNQGLPWQDIHKKFTNAFPKRERRVGSL
ncbi:hypothetical protein NKR19_g7999 [Coniochaeta hoffmannii]|uniref:Myb-like domain-containing protein n=1 Tax=Coniochaeta hoffmannii TaxID=91930 RepID=A0AA38R5M5_9PEZI|nr:hypothetical protein NKR19_g7999 [Coniochaeta hoffmannii]